MYAMQGVTRWHHQVREEATPGEWKRKRKRKRKKKGERESQEE
jgi:hypothetical protein